MSAENIDSVKRKWSSCVMPSYTKLFNSILASTVWNEDHATRVVWITLLAMKDRAGKVEGSIPGIAVIARVSAEEARKAFDKLMSPDPDSKNQDYDGRRIIPIENGWWVVSHDKYLRMMNQDERREYNRIKKREERAAAKEKAVSKNVSKSQQKSAESAHKDKDIDISTPKPPKGDSGKSLDETQKRLCRLYRRRETTRWSEKELKAYKKLTPIPEEDLALIEGYYREDLPAGEQDYRRRDLCTLLNNWPGEVDRARNRKTTAKTLSFEDKLQEI